MVHPDGYPTVSRIRLAGWCAACALLVIGGGCGQPGDGTESGTVVSADGVPIAYDDNGAGAVTLVFVHGWSCDRSYWDTQRTALSDRYRVVTVDLAGHGDSGLGRQRYTMRAFARDVATVIDDLELPRCVLVGHSMGGTVVVETARILPQRVIGLIGVDTLQYPRYVMNEERIQQLLAPFHEDFAKQTESFVRQMFPADADSLLVARIAADMAEAPPAVAIAALNEHLRHDLSPTLAEIAIPIRCLNGGLWPADSAAWADYAGGYEVEVMADSGHFPMLEEPDEFNRRLAAMVDALTTAASAE